MTPEHLTNEELANWMVPFTAIDDRSSGYIKSVIDEAARRLRNSMPKPVVDFIDDTLTVNGKYIACYDNEYAVDVYHNILHALGLEGGGDE